MTKILNQNLTKFRFFRKKIWMLVNLELWMRNFFNESNYFGSWNGLKNKETSKIKHKCLIKIGGKL